MAGGVRTRWSGSCDCGSPWWSASSRRLWARSMPPTKATSREGSSRWRTTTNFWWCEPPRRTRMSSSTSAPRRWSRSPRCRFSVAKKPVWSRCERHTRPRTSTPRSSADPRTSSTGEPGASVRSSSASPCQSVKRTRSPSRVALRASYSSLKYAAPWTRGATRLPSDQARSPPCRVSSRVLGLPRSGRVSSQSRSSVTSPRMPHGPTRHATRLGGVVS